jgi:hypothetical protein
MPARSESEDYELPHDEVDIDDLEEVEEVEEVDDDEAVVAVVEEEDEDGAASLDALIAQRTAARRASGDAEDEDDIMSALVTERDERLPEVIAPRVVPIKDRKEFVCNRCHLVKAKSQLADPQRGLCRDCV